MKNLRNIQLILRNIKNMWDYPFEILNKLLIKEDFKKSEINIRNSLSYQKM